MGSTTMVSEQQALAGRDEQMQVAEKHLVLGSDMKGPWLDCESVLFGMGCFWGAERLFWKQHGVVCTAAGYAGGFTKNPSYYEVCSGMTGHTEVVLVVYNPAQIQFDQLLSLFWQEHDPTQGMRQGNDRGTQYRSAIYTNSEQQYIAAKQSQNKFQQSLTGLGLAQITTEIKDKVPFYYAEPEHQQYLAKNPNGYCGLKGTGAKLL